MTADPPPEPTARPEPLADPAPGSEALAAATFTDPAARSGGARAAFRRWRRTRPFWATVWTALGGFIIFFLPMAPLGKILQVGVGGIAGMAGGVVLMAMALLMLLLPGQRHTAGVIAVIAGVASFPLSNLGGLFAGMTLSVLGGSMAFAWLPEKPAKRSGGLFRRTGPGGVPVGSGSV
ncbi:DUF6114 domain-containing protein [Streptomyces sp. NBC_00691]|uniref:DUF6114 domain-containing protein n=1 Tax=Streptomyces sp. NBC_00691 TaxID=2903671 RepID=UPI002E3285C2|nr:DUF6114 domain-containing protein [Streptomyces sp. NBC_00691]